MTDTQNFSHLRELAAKAADRHTGIWSDYVQMMEAYHHALNPATVIALLDKLEAAQAEIKRLQTAVKHLSGAAAKATFAEKIALVRLAGLEKQEPIRYWVNGAGTYDNESVAKDWAAEFKSEVVPLYTASGASPQPSQAGELSELEALSLLRFNETSEDGQEYDVRPSMMSRLAEIGVVSRKFGSVYFVTQYGRRVIAAINAKESK